MAIMDVVAYITIFCFIVNAAAAGPKECHACAERDESTCSANQQSQTCATDRNSLGTTHCASAVGKYRDQFGIVQDGFIRGCIDCADKKAACFALGGALKAREFWTLLKCEIECCTDDNCNTQDPTLSQAAITVFKPDDAGPTECHACAERDEATCTANQQSQTCATDQNSLGTSHCASAVGKYLDKDGKIQNGFIRGCIDCADKKAACFALGGALKAREVWTLLQCEIQCCTGNNCNTQTPTLTQAASTVFIPPGGSRVCHACAERDEATCSANQESQTCATDQNSLGTSHCASAAGKYRDKDGNVQNGFIRGCINCADKKAACFALGGALKARKVWTLLQCEIECCTGYNCNTQAPTLSQSAITVFTPNVAGPSECHACAERDEATCKANQKDQICATDENSLGTTHCASAFGKYLDKDGKTQDGFIRGCIDCADKKAACFALAGALKAREFWTITQCEIECCTDKDCNTQAPTLSKDAIPVFKPDDAGSPTAKGPIAAGNRLGLSVLISAGVPAFAIVLGNSLYHF